MSRDRYAQCDGTCTVDCGACKGAGRPTIPPPNPLLMATVDGNPAVPLVAPTPAAVPDPPECPTCGKRQWPVIHSCTGIRPTAAVPDPRFRDQLAEAVCADLCRIPRVWTGDFGPGEIAELVADLPSIGQLIAVEVEARVQAAANQWAAEGVDRCPQCRSSTGHWHGCGYGIRADVLDSPDHGKA